MRINHSRIKNRKVKTIAGVMIILIATSVFLILQAGITSSVEDLSRTLGAIKLYAALLLIGVNGLFLVLKGQGFKWPSASVQIVVFVLTLIAIISLFIPQ